MRAFGLTDVGLKRAVNQDAFFIDHDKQLYIVADGMGGHKAGDNASRTALASIVEYFNEHDHELNEDIQSPDEEEQIIKKAELLCKNAIEYANDVVFNKAKERLEFHGMGTTVVLLKVIIGYAIVAHVGDSRIYRIQDEKIMQLTKDHSRIQELIDQKKITLKEAEKYPLKNVITRALGGAQTVQVDTSKMPLGRSDVFILCTDGLSGVMSDPEIFEIVSSNPGDPEESCRRLVQCTLDRGAPDNVTVVVCDTRAYTGGEPESPLKEPLPIENSKGGSFRRIIDKWFKDK